MAHSVIISIFKLKEGVVSSDFMIASDGLNEDYLSKQEGYVSRQLLSNGEIWTDILTYDTMENAQRAIEIAYAGNAPSFTEYMTFIKEDAEETCDYLFTIVKSY